MMTKKLFQTDMDWASDLEMLGSAINAGLPIHDSIELVSKRGSSSWSWTFSLVHQKYESAGNLSVALSYAKTQVGDRRFDLLAEMLSANQQLGGAGIVDWISQSAVLCRRAATSIEESASRLRSVLGVARLGVLSPWIMCALLASRPENLASYLSGQGLLILAIGALLSGLAWVIALKIAKMPPATRGLAA